VAALARERPLVISGGLTADNVGACVRAVRPYAVDVRSGIETGGFKDAGKMRDFVTAVREADSSPV
jgi:phosphoribosylanthranilate isomerase